MLKRVVKSLMLIGGLIITSVYADDIVIKKPIGYTGEGPEQIIVQDRNVGAISNDITSEDSYGYHFQRGNNHGLSPDAPITEEKVEWNDNYAQNGYYGGDSFILSLSIPYDYWNDGVLHNNLRGGENDNKSNHWGLDTILETQKNRQGPCDEGYHVPSAGEWSKVFEYWCLSNSDKCDMANMEFIEGLYSNHDSVVLNNFRLVLKIPFTDQFNYVVGSWYNDGETAHLRTSSPGGGYARSLSFLGTSVYAHYSDFRACGFNVRCFKNYNVESSVSYNFDYKTLITILISFLIGGGVGFCIYHHCTKRRSKSQ